MIKTTIKTKEELKKFYENLNSEFEGYIQMSDEKLNKIFITKQKLPKYDEIHHKNNFIFEMALFDGDRSILVRQFNDKFLVTDEKLSEFEEKTEDKFFSKKKNKKVVITTIWQEEKTIVWKDGQECETLKTLKPTMQLFSGFDKGEEK
jgi:CRISPR type III-associated protein (TIGR04423 family)